MMESIWDGEGLFLIMALSFRMNSWLIGHLSEAEVWPGPWVEQVGVQLGSFDVWAVERQVGQTDFGADRVIFTLVVFSTG